MPCTGRPRKFNTEAEQAEGKRARNQRYRQRQKDPNDTPVIQQDDEAIIWQDDKGEDKEEVVKNEEEDSDPDGLYRSPSPPKPKIQLQHDDDKEIQKTIQDLSTIRLDSTSPIKSTRYRISRSGLQ